MACNYYEELERRKISRMSEREMERYLKHQAVVKGVISAIDCADKGIPHPQIIDREKSINDIIDRKISEMELAEFQRERIAKTPNPERNENIQADPYADRSGWIRDNWTGD
ncbi:hypothetical protein [Pectobacterium parmentieri]|uniref:hypothetical protein n=1 Tax=Pectobacterium parmentieri TaxID=1905730 RepID=UPI000F8E28C7|nr:hypothetical protein [Pectobacterium parmentieri]AZS56748.1 hypothetical protein C5E18_11755 [Pectobacterium parmentieri]MBI0431761.1 hypothetical protein [Pectobacterium parmentieri]